MHEFMSLLQCGVEVPELYIFLRDDRSVVRPVPGVISWPVEFLLTKFNRKHVFADRTMCSLELVSLEVRNFINRISWRAALRSSPESRWRHLRTKPSSTPCCPIDSELLSNRLRNLAEDLFQEIRRSRLADKFHMPVYPKVIQFAMRLLRKGPWAVVPADKDGCFVLVDKEELHSIHLEVMRRPEYVYKSRSPKMVEDMAEEYGSIVFEVCKTLADDELRSALLSGFRATNEKGWARMCSRLQINIKSHKPAGKVGYRPIHSSVATPLLPAYRWIASLLRPYLDSRQHLLRDSFAAFDKLRSIRLPKNIRFYRYDLEDFFLSGSHGELTRLCAEVVDLQYRDAFIKVCGYVLANQVVTVENYEAGVWLVKTGSGMGLSCSPEIANTAFDRLVETRITRQLRSSCSVVLYVRFMDDGLILGCGPRGTQIKFFETLRQAANGIFRIIVESVSEQECTFLDLRVHKGQGFKKTGLLDIEIFKKPTSLARPLRPSSYHMPCVHTSWPRALMYRSQRLCSSPKEAEADMARMKLIWDQYGIMVYDALPIPRAPKVVFGRLVLPYHSSLAKVRCGRVLRRHAQGLALAAGEDPKASLQISWKLGYPRLMTKLQRLQAIEHENYEKFDFITVE